MTIESQDIYSGGRITWRWVWVGVLVVLGMATLLAATAVALGASSTAFSTYFVSSIVAFVLGGVVIGWLSPGHTPWEAGVASLIAAAWMAFLAMRLLDFVGTGAGPALPVGLAIGLGCGLAGGWIGEKLQARGKS